MRRRRLLLFKVGACTFLIAITVVSLLRVFLVIFSDDEEIPHIAANVRQKKRPKYFATASLKHADQLLLKSNDDLLVEKLFADRRAAVSEICHQYLGYRPSRYRSLVQYKSKPAYELLLVDDEHQLIFCGLAKVASTKFKKLLILLSSSSNYTSADEIDEKAVHDEGFAWPYFRPINAFTDEELELRLNRYKKFIFVRNPYERALDAWVSNFTRGTYSSEKSSVKVDIVPLNSNRNGEAQKGNLARNHLRSRDEMKVRAKFETFQQYMDFLAKADSSTLDNVWYGHYYENCLACVLEYDYIGRLENEAEIEYVFQKITGRREIPFEKLQTDSLDLLYRQLLSGASVQSLTSFSQRYQLDRLMFGY